MISIIVAIGKNNEIGKNNDLIWHLKEDLKNFKNITSNHKVIMGYNTYKSIGKPLPNRTNIVLCDHFENIEGVTLYTDISEMIDKEINNNEEVFIIGGSSLYNYFIDKCDRLYITKIYDTCDDADTYFPTINENLYDIKSIGKVLNEEVEYEYFIYERHN